MIVSIIIIQFEANSELDLGHGNDAISSDDSDYLRPRLKFRKIDEGYYNSRF